MRVGIYGRVLDQRNLEEIQFLFDQLSLNEIDYIVEKRFYDILTGKVRLKDGIEKFKHSKAIHKVDYLLSLGGDGTLLDTITYIRDSNVPILGINLGKLGFLSSIAKDEVSQAVEALKQNKVEIDTRILLQLTSNKKIFNSKFALNDFTLHKKDRSSMITVHTYINDRYLNSYWADGLVVSTPTGSTAYSLSCNGPILFPSVKGFVIAPVAPHNLNVRPVVVPDDSKISFKVSGSIEKEKFLCTLDSRFKTIDDTYEITLEKANFTINLVRLPESDFATTLRNKLMWGLDKRN